MVSKVCPRSQGQPPSGLRSARMKASNVLISRGFLSSMVIAPPPCHDSHNGYYGMSASSANAADLHAQPVIGRLDAGGQRPAQRGVVQIDMHVGQDCPPGPEPLDPGKRLGDGEMARMRRGAHGMGAPQIEVGKPAVAVVIHAADIWRVCDIADA